MSDELHVLHHPQRCRHLLSKGLYINAGIKRGCEVTGDGNFWCGKTQTVMGPDRKLCDRDYCLEPGRGCHEAV